MPWHTIDGLFFLSFSAYYLFERNFFWALFFSSIAAATKQPYFATTFYLLFGIILFRMNFSYKFDYKIIVFLLLIMFMLYDYHIYEGLFYYKTSKRENLVELYNAGIKVYLEAIKSWLILLVVVVVSLIIYYKNKNKNKWFEILVVVLFCISLIVPIFNFILGRDELNLHRIINLLLPMFFVREIIRVYKKRNIDFVFYQNLFVLLIIWSSSISWGANTIFLALPFFFCLFKINLFSPKSNFILSGIVFLFLILRIFNPYVEKNIFETNYRKIKNYPLLSGIYTSSEHLEYLQEAKEISEKYNKNVLFLPGFPLATIYLEKKNNRANWEMDIEYPNIEKDLSLLNDKNLIFVLDKKEIISSEDDFYKSSFTKIVRKNIEKIDSTTYFYIYK